MGYTFIMCSSPRWAMLACGNLSALAVTLAAVVAWQSVLAPALGPEMLQATLRSPTACMRHGLAGRFAHAADAGDGALFVFGGLCNEEPVDDLHVLMVERRASRFEAKVAPLALPCCRPARGTASPPGQT